MERLFLDIISGKKRGVIPTLIKGALLSASYLYACGISARNTFFNNGWRKISRQEVPVISIGNIIAGGAGKTPVTIAIAKELLTRGHRVAIVLRGYRSPAERGKPLAVSLGDGPIYPPSVCGDEAFMIARQLPRALVFVSANKRASARMAVANGAEVILLDDGFQHRQIHRDLDIVVLDAKNLFGYGALLPRGLLREGPHALARADLVVVNHAAGTSSEDRIKEVLGKYTAAPVVTTYYQVAGFRDITTHAKITHLQGPVAIVSGIGSPDRFADTIKALGISIADHWHLPDHRAPPKEELCRRARSWRQQGLSTILCTEKDAVKWPTVSLELPAVYVEVMLGYHSGKSHFDTAIATISRTLL